MILKRELPAVLISLFLVVALLSITGFLHLATPTVVLAQADGGDGYYYRVQPGDSWNAISSRTGLSIRELQRVNPQAVRRNSWLRNGEWLFVPSGQGEPAEQRYHVVQHRESWISIARQYDIPVRLLQSANPRSIRRGYVLYRGEELLVPPAAEQTAASSSDESGDTEAGEAEASVTETSETKIGDAAVADDSSEADSSESAEVSAEESTDADTDESAGENAAETADAVDTPAQDSDEATSDEGDGEQSSGEGTDVEASVEEGEETQSDETDTDTNEGDSGDGSTADDTEASETEGEGGDEEPTPEPLVHIVQRGDSWSTVAAQYGVSFRDLRNANVPLIRRNDILRAGDRLTIPGQFQPAEAEGSGEEASETEDASESVETTDESEPAEAPAATESGETDSGSDESTDTDKAEGDTTSVEEGEAQEDADTTDTDGETEGEDSGSEDATTDSAPEAEEESTSTDSSEDESDGTAEEGTAEGTGETEEAEDSSDGETDGTQVEGEESVSGEGEADEEATEASGSDSAEPIIHRVSSGESWSTIAARYGISIRELQAANPGAIRARQILRVGDQLTIPGQAQADVSDTPEEAEEPAADSTDDATAAPAESEDTETTDTEADSDVEDEGADTADETTSDTEAETAETEGEEGESSDEGASEDDTEAEGGDTSAEPESDNAVEGSEADDTSDAEATTSDADAETDDAGDSDAEADDDSGEGDEVDDTTDAEATTSETDAETDDVGDGDAEADADSSAGDETDDAEATQEEGEGETGDESATEEVIHRVGRGDSWSTIAARYGISIRELQAANPGSVRARQILRVGEQLTIPGQAQEDESSTSEESDEADAEGAEDETVEPAGDVSQDATDGEEASDTDDTSDSADADVEQESAGEEAEAATDEDTGDEDTGDEASEDSAGSEEGDTSDASSEDSSEEGEAVDDATDSEDATSEADAGADDAENETGDESGTGDAGDGATEGDTDESGDAEAEQDEDVDESGETSATEEVTHQVGSGDSWSTIAARYGISIRELQATNPGLIRAGQVLRVGDQLNIPGQTPVDTSDVSDTTETADETEADSTDETDVTPETDAEPEADAGDAEEGSDEDGSDEAVEDGGDTSDASNTEDAEEGEAADVDADSEDATADSDDGAENTEAEAESTTSDESNESTEGDTEATDESDETATIQDEETDDTPDAEEVTHQVGAGDSWNRIAARYGVSVRELQAANPGLIRSGQVLRVGEQLTIPAQTEAESDDGAEASESDDEGTEAADTDASTDSDGAEGGDVSSDEGETEGEGQAVDDATAEAGEGEESGTEEDTSADDGTVEESGESTAGEESTGDGETEESDTASEDSTAESEDTEDTTQEEIIHRVGVGDSWSTIAAQYGLSVQELQDANPGLVRSGEVLIVSDELKIPAAGTPVEAEGTDEADEAGEGTDVQAAIQELSCPESFNSYAELLVSLLNSEGGSPDTVAEFLQRCEAYMDDAFTTADFTGDGTDDLVVAYANSDSEATFTEYDLMIFNSVDDGSGQYDVGYQARAAGEVELLETRDINDDGQTDIVWVDRTCGASTCFETLNVRSWDGSSWSDWTDGTITMAYPEIALEDILAESNGLEFTLQGGQYGSVGAGPPRGRVEIWGSLDGQPYTLIEKTYDESECLYFKVVDANQSFLNGPENGFEEADALYESAITNEALTPCWTRPDELSELRSFSQFRRALIAGYQGDSETASILTEQLSIAYEGTIYDQVGQTWLSSYSENGNVFEACAATNQFAEENPLAWEILADYGYANPSFEASDVCPILDMDVPPADVSGLSGASQQEEATEPEASEDSNGAGPEGTDDASEDEGEDESPEGATEESSNDEAQAIAGSATIDTLPECPSELGGYQDIIPEVLTVATDDPLVMETWLRTCEAMGDDRGAVLFADLNVDGTRDVIAFPTIISDVGYGPGGAQGVMLIYHGTEGGEYTLMSAPDVAGKPTPLIIDDVNADGKLDMAWTIEGCSTFCATEVQILSWNGEAYIMSIEPGAVIVEGQARFEEVSADDPGQGQQLVLEGGVSGTIEGGLEVPHEEIWQSVEGGPYQRIRWTYDREVANNDCLGLRLVEAHFALQGSSVLGYDEAIEKYTQGLDPTLQACSIFGLSEDEEFILLQGLASFRLIQAQALSGDTDGANNTLQGLTIGQPEGLYTLAAELWLRNYNESRDPEVTCDTVESTFTENADLWRITDNYGYNHPALAAEQICFRPRS